MLVQKANSYRGGLSPVQAANAMRAARLNSLDLVDTAEMLFNLKRFGHSAAFSILSIEESGKLSILLMVFLGFGGDKANLWRAYRSHRAKTETLNVAILSRIRVHFPKIAPEDADKIAELGPSPDELEVMKQRAIYSDCYTDDAKGLVVHLPRNADWRSVAWERLSEAKSVALAARDYPPQELEIWFKHAEAAHADGRDYASILSGLNEELKAKGFIKEGQWGTLLAEVERAREPRPRDSAEGTASK